MGGRRGHDSGCTFEEKRAALPDGKLTADLAPVGKRHGGEFFHHLRVEVRPARFAAGCRDDPAFYEAGRAEDAAGAEALRRDGRVSDSQAVQASEGEGVTAEPSRPYHGVVCKPIAPAEGRTRLGERIIPDSQV